ncbi:MAG: hypothetical protein ACTTKH_00075 [Treponema sp.]
MKKRFRFVALALLASAMLIMMFSSCNNQAKNKNFELDTSKIWGKNIGAKSTTVESDSKNKKLEIHAENCEEYKYTYKIGTNSGNGTTTNGALSVDIPDIPTTDTDLAITLSATGFNDYKITGKIKREVKQAYDVKVLFNGGESGTDEDASEGRIFNTTKTRGTVKIMTTENEMVSVSVNGNDAAPDSNKKSASTVIDINGDVDVEVKVKFQYLEEYRRTFKIKKYTSTSEFPVQVVSAKILSGPNYGSEKNLTFDGQNKVSISLSDIEYSNVKLEMEFESAINSREVKECKDGRPNPYTLKSESSGGKIKFSSDAIVGHVSGYVVAEIGDDGTEKKLEQIKSGEKKYSEVLIVGKNFSSYKIEVTGSNTKKATYEIEIKRDGDINTTLLDKNFVGIYNGLSGRSTSISSIFLNGIILPYFNKGPILKRENGKNDICFNNGGFTDLAYMDHMGLLLEQEYTDDAFYFFYNIYGNGTSNVDKHEFKKVRAKMVKEKTPKGKEVDVAQLKFNIKNDELKDKYLDAFMAAKKALPNPILADYYGQKWRRTATKHGWLLGLENKKEIVSEVGKLSAGIVFGTIFNYRIQAMAYDEQHKEPSSNDKYLTISSNQSYKSWEANVGDPKFSSFLSGETGENRDTFYLTPIFADKSIIQKVTYTIQKADNGGTNFTDVDEHKEKDITAKDVNGKTRYIIGSNGTQYEFTTGNIYRVIVTVTYTDSNSEKFSYQIDYKNKQELDIM